MNNLLLEQAIAAAAMRLELSNISSPINFSSFVHFQQVLAIDNILTWKVIQSAPTYKFASVDAIASYIWG